MSHPRTCALALLTLLISGSTPADSLIAPPVSGSLAFARYLASLHRRDPFRESGPIAVMIEASLPGIRKEGRLVAIRDIDNSERTEYKVIGTEGDPAVIQQVIATYLAEEKEIQDLPLSSVIITPANYRFRFIGETRAGGASAYVFRIVPKKKRTGLIRGELWIDSATGMAVVQAGYFVKTASAGVRRIEMVRDTKFQEGSPSSRITRVAVETRRAGRGYLTITEFPSAAIRAPARAAE